LVFCIGVGAVEVGDEQVFWRATRNTGVNLRPQTPLSYPSQKKTVQNDVTLIHSQLKSALKKTLQILV